MKVRACVRGDLLAGTLTAALLVAGCGKAGQVDPYPGRMIATYGDATTPDAIRGRELLKNGHVLDELAGDVNASLKLPDDVAPVGEQCGQVNATWNSTDRRIKLGRFVVTDE